MPLKIGITCYPTYGGSGVVATELGKQLALGGHTVHFIASALPYRLDQLDEHIQFHEVEAMNYPLFEYVPYALALATKMFEVAESEQLNLLHVHYAIPHSISAFLAREMMAPHRLPIITTLHGTDITLVGKDRSYLPITRFGIQRSDGVTAVSEYLKQATYQEFNVDCDIRVISNFVDVELFVRRPKGFYRERFAPRGEKVLVHLSNFRPIKRITDAVEILAHVVKEMPTVLLMVGDGVERSRAEHMARERGVSDRVFFLGKSNEVPSILSDSDLMLLPSELESFGLAALEAMACEVPVVATNAGGLPELIGDGHSGYLCQVGDLNNMASRALDILGDAARHRQMGQAARRVAVERYSSDRVIPLYQEYYREVLNQKAED